jgi:TrAA12-like
MECEMRWAWHSTATTCRCPPPECPRRFLDRWNFIAPHLVPGSEIDFNRLWGVENSGDNFQRAGKDIHQNNPAEKLNYIGDVVNPKGTWFGYPVSSRGLTPVPIPDLARGIFQVLSGKR